MKQTLPKKKVISIKSKSTKQPLELTEAQINDIVAKYGEVLITIGPWGQMSPYLDPQFREAHLQGMNPYRPEYFGLRAAKRILALLKMYQDYLNDHIERLTLEGMDDTTVH